MPKALPLFLICALLGWAASGMGWKENSPATAAAASSAGAERRDARLRLRTPEELAAWSQQRAGSLKGNPWTWHTWDSELKNWSAAELRAALAQSLADPAAVNYGPEQKAMLSLLEEWTRREPDAAWAWLQSAPTDAMKLRLGGAFFDGWPPERAEEGLEMVIAHTGMFYGGGGYTYGGVMCRAFESAARRGPAGVDALLARIQEKGMQYPSEDMTFPPGFDFAGLVRSPAMSDLLARTSDKPFIPDAWMSQSPEAAFDGLMTMNRENGADLSRHIFEALQRKITADPGVMEDRARRIGGHLASLPAAEEQQQVAMAGVKSLARDPGTLKAFVSGITDPALQAQASLAGAEHFMGGDNFSSGTVLTALELLETGRTPVERLAALETMAMPGQWMNDLQVQELATRISAWGATPEQAARLAGDIKKGRKTQ